MSKNKESYIKNILTLSSVPLISQIVGLFLTPVLTRLYSPEDFGLLNLFSSIAGVVIIFSTFGYHNAIILPKENKKSLNIFFLSILLSIIVSIIFFITLIFLSKYFIFFQDKYSEKFIYLLSIFVFLHGLYQSLRYLNIRYNNFKDLALSRISDTLVNKFSAIYFGYTGYNIGFGLIYSLLFAAISKNIFLLKSKMNDILIFLKNDINYDSFCYLLVRYKKFPKFSLLSELLSRFPALIIATLIVKFYNELSLGYYSLALMVISVPMVVISNSILEVFTPAFAKSIHTNKHVELLEKVNLRIISLLLYPFTILAFFGGPLFQFVFGDNWYIAGLICQILTIKSFFEIVFIPSIQLINIIERQELNLYRRITNLIFVSLSILIGYHLDSFILTILFISISEALTSLIFGYYVMVILKHSLYKILNKSFIYLLISGFLVLILCLINYYYNTWFILISCILFSTIIYYTLLLYIDIDLKKKIIKDFNLNS